jgi:hypothetical protein
MTVDGHTAAAQHPREYVVIGMCTSADRWPSGWFARGIDSRIDRERSGPLESPINSSLNPSLPSLLLACIHFSSLHFPSHAFSPLLLYRKVRLCVCSSLSRLAGVGVVVMVCAVRKLSWSAKAVQ